MAAARSASARRVFVTLAVFVAAVAAPRAQTAQENEADARWLVSALEIHAGSTVGEIGAGGGELTIAIANVVGPSGRVFSNELNTDRLKAIETMVEKTGLQNVTAVEGRENEGNLPDQCCDAIFMRNVYHHFGAPPRMNVSLLKSLKPGGRLAIIDFAPIDSENPPGKRAEGSHHGVTATTVERELKAVGFEIVSSSATADRTVRVVARRP